LNFLNTLYGGRFSQSALLVDGFFPNFMADSAGRASGHWLVVAALWLVLSGVAIITAARRTTPR